MNTLISELRKNRTLSDEGITELLSMPEGDPGETALFTAADEVRREHYGTDVYIRGLIEFTNYCKNNCYYCGIRRGNTAAVRYRLSEEEILSCCEEGYSLGFRTFVLQGGEDPFFTDDRIVSIVSRIHSRFPDCAITLSVGEKPRESYARYREAGAARYLLRHESAAEEHYSRLHPPEMSLANRKRCLRDLKELGYQVGAGFMVGSPGQTIQHLITDLRFLQELQPDMIGIGPYLNHPQTPFKDEPNGSLSRTLRLLAILRLMFPYCLLPATTALGTLHPRGREMGLCAGANVVMPNLSPVRVRRLYELYENKICTGDESAQCRHCLEQRVESIGYHVASGAIGDAKRNECH